MYLTKEFQVAFVLLSRVLATIVTQYDMIEIQNFSRYNLISITLPYSLEQFTRKYVIGYFMWSLENN